MQPPIADLNPISASRRIAERAEQRHQRQVELAKDMAYETAKQRVTQQVLQATKRAKINNKHLLKYQIQQEEINK